MKIVVVSDNHSNAEVLNKIHFDNPDADYYFHLGDSEMDQSALRPFISVRGNMDHDYNMHLERIISVDKHSFYLCHGHSYSSNVGLIANNAKLCNCDIALFGHTHCFFDEVIEGIRVINPGSVSKGKDGNNSYVIINIEDDNVKVIRKIIN